MFASARYLKPHSQISMESSTVMLPSLFLCLNYICFTFLTRQVSLFYPMLIGLASGNELRGVELAKALIAGNHGQGRAKAVGKRSTWEEQLLLSLGSKEREQV